VQFEETAIPTPREFGLKEVRLNIDESQLWDGLIHGLPDHRLDQGYERIDLGMHLGDTAGLVDESPPAYGSSRHRFAGRNCKEVKG
jgi:hypothetical protein